MPRFQTIWDTHLVQNWEVGVGVPSERRQHSIPPERRKQQKLVCVLRVFSRINKNGEQGGREKAPAAFCRKAICSTKDFEMWGDGEQTRSFMFIDDCVEGTIRIMEGDYKLPLNLGTEEMVGFADVCIFRRWCTFFVFTLS